MKKLIGLFVVIMMVFFIAPSFAIDIGSLDCIDSTLFTETCIKCGGGTSRVYDLEKLEVDSRNGILTSVYGEINECIEIRDCDCSACQSNKGDGKGFFQVKKISSIERLRLVYDSSSQLAGDFLVKVDDTRGNQIHKDFITKVKNEYAQVILANCYVQAKLGKETYYIYKDLLSELGISEEGRLFYIKGESLSLGQAIGKDLYVNEITDDRGEYCLENKIKISSVYADGLDPHYLSLTPNSNNEIGSENFWVCDSCAKCGTCDRTVASSGSDTILAYYCPDHLCDFFWEVDTGDGIEGLFCKEGKKVEGSYFCTAHKCIACKRPITGVNLEPIINVDFIANNYAGSDESMYSNYCIEHYCLKPYCRNIRSNNNAGYEYCEEHLGKCLYPGCTNVLPNVGNEKLCNKHALNEFIVCESCGNVIFDKKCPQCENEVIKCKRCDNVIKDDKCRFCGREEESWKDKPRTVICEHKFDGEVKYQPVGKFGDENFGHIVIGHCKKCSMDINEWEKHKFDEKGNCVCGYICDHEFNMTEGVKETCECIKCGYVSKHKFVYQDERSCICVLCRYTIAHSFINQDKEKCGYCAYCNYTLLHEYDTTITYEYLSVPIIDNGIEYGKMSINTHHFIIKKCKKCEYIEMDSGMHTFIWGEIKGGEFERVGEECTICGFKAKCVYNHSYGEYCELFSKDQHKVTNTCVNCGESFIEYEAHEYIDGKCYKCGELKECIDSIGHNIVKEYDYDSYYYHRVIEYCTKCKVAFDAGLERHIEECSKCSPKGTCQSGEHIYNITCETKNDSYHSTIEKCVLCGYVKNKESNENHYWANAIECSKCGYRKVCTSDSGHRYVLDYEYISEMSHKEIKKCVQCGQKGFNIIGHTLVREGFFSHSYKCKKCGYNSDKKCKNDASHIYERSVRSLSDNKHEVIYTCGVCEDKKIEKEVHNLYIVESTEIVYKACKECDYYKKIK